MTSRLDGWVHALQSIPPFNIYQITEKGEVTPWWAVKPHEIAKDLVINENDVLTQVELVSAQIMQWGRLHALAQQVADIEERGYRVWRDKTIIKLSDPPEGKAPAQWKCEAMMRQDKAYTTWQNKTARAKAAVASAHAVLEGFRAKARLLNQFARREGEQMRISA